MSTEEPKQLPPNAAEMMDDLLRNTPTPNLRLYAFMALRTTATQLLAQMLSAGKISREAAIWWSDRINALKGSVSGNFIDTIAEVHAMLSQFIHERAVEISALEDGQRSLFLKVLPYLHDVALSPPPNHLSEDAPERTRDLEDFLAFVREFNKETDRGAALVGASLVDNRLEQLLHAHFVNGAIANELLSKSANSPLNRFGARIQLSYALGLITKVEYREAEIIRRIRNAFAHRLHGLSFDDQQIAAWCRNLKSMPYESLGPPRQRFINSVITLCMVLWYRPAHAAPYKAQERKWTWHLAFGTNPNHQPRL
jgi:mannitol operon repressor